MKNETDNLFPNWIYFLFLLSRSVLLIVFILCLALFFFYEDFMTVIVNELKFSVSGESVYVAIIFFQFFNSIHILFIMFFASATYYIILYIFLNDKRHEILDIAFPTFFTFVILHHALTKLDVLAVFILSGIYLLIYKLNERKYCLFPKRHCAVFYAIPPALVPCIFELFFPSYIIFFLRNIKQQYLINKKWDDLGRKISMIFGANILIFITINLTYPTYYLPNSVKQILPGRFYSMQIDESTNRLFACNNEENNLYVLNLNNLQSLPKIIKINTQELQDMKINKNNREFYHFDRGENKLLIFDLDHYMLKKTLPLQLNGSGSARVCFDNQSRTFVISREDNYVFLLDMQTLLPIKQIEIRNNDEILFDINTNMYIITTFHDSDNIYFIPPRGQNVFKIKSELNQAGISISNKRKELYVCFPLRSKIFVYDLNNYHLKRKISTVFGAKHIACDDINDYIIVSSIWSGFIDIINLKNEKHSKMFIGYYLREVALNQPKREAFISSFKSGIFKINY